jgi:hypothetical protein
MWSANLPGKSMIRSYANEPEINISILGLLQDPKEALGFLAIVSQPNSLGNPFFWARLTVTELWYKAPPMNGFLVLG